MSVTMQNLKICFEAAIGKAANYVGVLVEMDGFETPEVIVNCQENIEQKLAYYENTYDENLQHKFAPGIRIIGFTFGGSLIDIESDLLTRGVKGVTVEEMITDKAEFGFGMAVDLMKEGHKVARKGWNGKGMWIAVSGPKGNVLKAEGFWNKHSRKFAEENGGEAEVLPYLIMKTADGKILMGWLASQTDILTEDWMVLE